MERGRILATTCGHIFHESCIVNWTLRSYSCPECRNQPTFPLRTIHFTSQEQLDTQESDTSLESIAQADSSGFSLPLKPMSLQDSLSGSGYSQRNTADMRKVLERPVNSPKTDHISSRQCTDGCGVCNRFHFLIEKAITLRNMIKEHENAQQMESRTPSEKLMDPEVKRKRTV
uniref:RING-type domain-containing protein n=1 Tax=Anopheles minimus TaxID=112268 RepID=A0A182WMT2_9DIPT